MPMIPLLLIQFEESQSRVRRVLSRRSSAQFALRNDSNWALGNAMGRGRPGRRIGGKQASES